jgi:hypothetical protein
VFSRTFAIAAVIATLLHALPAQLSGELHDSRGVAIAAATVELRSAGTVLHATTGEDGVFTIPDPPAGDYSIVASRGATAKSPRTLHLPLAGSTLSLEWSAENSLLVRTPPAAQTGTGGERLSSKAVSELPLNKRDFSQLLLLAAGTMTDTNGAANFTQQFTINGQRGTAAVFAMDGADSSDPEMGGATFSNFNVDAVQEIRSSSGWMPA